jgi:taurine transport system permease protein
MVPKFVCKKQILTRGISMISITLILIIWTVSTNLKWLDPVFLPTPQSVWRAFLELIRDGYKGTSLSTHIPYTK